MPTIRCNIVCQAKLLLLVMFTHYLAAFGRSFVCLLRGPRRFHSFACSPHLRMCSLHTLVHRISGERECERDERTQGQRSVHTAPEKHFPFIELRRAEEEVICFAFVIASCANIERRN